jgi:phenylacetate-CoA ligase
VLLQVPELTPHYRLVLTRERTLDEVEVQVEVAESHFGHDSAALRALEERVERLIRETIGTSMRVTLLEPGQGPHSEGGKLARVDDRRTLA